MKISVKKPNRGTTNMSSLSTGSFLLYNKSITANSTTAGDYDLRFGDEAGRLLSSSYTSQGNVSDSGNQWNSQTTGILAENALIVYGQPVIGGDLTSVQSKNFNRIISPNSDNLSYKNGNFSGLDAPATPPNLSTGYDSDFRFAFFKYQNGSGDTPTFTVTLRGYNFAIKPASTTPSGNNINVFFKVPGTTGYRDVATAAPPAGTYTATDDFETNGNNVGCFNGTVDLDNLSVSTTNASISLPLQFSEQIFAANDFGVLMVKTHKDWNGYFYQIEIS
jgi:hypothetical protein